MTKIKAVLDQETWVEVDVPDEFQAIVTSLVCSEAVVTGSTDDVQGNLMTNDNEVPTSNNSTLKAQSGQESAQQQIDRTDSSEILEQNMAQIQPTSSTEGNERNKADASSSSVQSNNNNIERGKSTSQTLIYGGVGYHMVNWLVILFFLSFSPQLSPFATVSYFFFWKLYLCCSIRNYFLWRCWLSMCILILKLCFSCHRLNY